MSEKIFIKQNKIKLGSPGKDFKEVTRLDLDDPAWQTYDFFLVFDKNYPETKLKKILGRNKEKFSINDDIEYRVSDLIIYINLSMKEGQLRLERFSNNSYYITDLTAEERSIFKGLGLKMLCKFIRFLLKNQLITEDLFLDLEPAPPREKGLINYYKDIGFISVEDTIYMEIKIKDFINSCKKRGFY